MFNIINFVIWLIVLFVCAYILLQMGFSYIKRRIRKNKLKARYVRQHCHAA